MLKEKTINLLKPITSKNLVKIARNQRFSIEKIDADVISKILKKRNDFFQSYNSNVITKDNLIALITTINAIAIDADGVMWADFNVTIYSK